MAVKAWTIFTLWPFIVEHLDFPGKIRRNSCMFIFVCYTEKLLPHTLQFFVTGIGKNLDLRKIFCILLIIKILRSCRKFLWQSFRKKIMYISSPVNVQNFAITVRYFGRKCCHFYLYQGRQRVYSEYKLSQKYCTRTVYTFSDFWDLKFWSFENIEILLILFFPKF